MATLLMSRWSGADLRIILDEIGPVPPQNRIAECDLHGDGMGEARIVGRAPKACFARFAVRDREGKFTFFVG